jgi:long-chain acyl-CoA synthetase
MADSVPGLLMERAAEAPSRIALLEKEFGRWVEIPWSEYAANVRAAALGFQDAGLRAGDTVVIVAENSAEWLYADLGVQSVGARSVAVSATTPGGEIGYIIGDSGARWVVVGDQEQTDKVLDVLVERSDLSVERVVYIKEKGVSSYQEEFLGGYHAMVARGREIDAAEPARFDSLLAARSSSEVAVISYTAGTTGVPKGVVATHGTMLAATSAFQEAFPTGPEDRILAWVSLAHPSIRGPQAYTSFRSGATVAFPENAETFHEALNEIAPTSVMCPPRFLEVTAADIQIRMRKSTIVKKGFYRLASVLGRGAAKRQSRSGSHGPIGNLQRKASWWFAGKAILDKLGLDKTTWAFAGGASISRDLLGFFHALGLPLRQVYGQAETTGIAIAQYASGPIVPGVAGTPIPGVEARVGDDGALSLRGPGLFDGYVGQDASAALDAGGWFATGDLVEQTASGEFVLLDRESAVMSLSDGTRIVPNLVENSLKFSPYIANAVVIANGRAFPTALIQIEFTTVAEFAQTKGEAFTTFDSLATLDIVADLIAEEVAAANRRLEAELNVRSFRLLDREFSADQGEVTPSGRIRRDKVEQGHAALIEEMYSEASTAS